MLYQRTGVACPSVPKPSPSQPSLTTPRPNRLTPQNTLGRHQDLPQLVRLLIDLPDNVNKPDIVSASADDLPRDAPGRVAPLPLAPDAERLVGPGAEADLLDQRRRDDLLAGETAPGDAVDRRRRGRGLELGRPVLVFAIIPVATRRRRHRPGGCAVLALPPRIRGRVPRHARRDVGAQQERAQHVAPVARGDPELDERLLEHEAAARTPAEHRIGARRPVGRRLRRHAPPAAPLDQRDQLRLDQPRLGRQVAVPPAARAAVAAAAAALAPGQRV